MLSQAIRRAGCGGWAIAVALALSGCGKTDAGDDQIYTVVTLPNGKQVKAESVYRDLDITRGLMFRDRLAADHGMLFLHIKMDKYQYWTYNLKFPLDIVWMDEQHKVVEVYPNAPPCTAKSARECPTYGGRHLARFVLEMNANTAVPNGIREGVYLMF
jgi:uncharacterized protein